MTIKAVKDVVVGDVLREVPGYDVNPREVLSVFCNVDASMSLLGASGDVINVYFLSKSTVDVIEKPKVFEGLRQRIWGTLMGNVSYKTNNGTDPEIFVVDEKDQVIPAWMFLPDKNVAAVNRLPYWDGFQAEFYVQPSHCLNAQNDGTAVGLRAVLAAAKKTFPKAKLSIKNTVEISPEMLNSAKDEHVALGCAPSHNAYGLTGIDVPNPRMLRYRFAGGHIHKQMHKLLPVEANRIVKVLDALVAVPCVTMFQKLDDPIRRKFYGLPGEYRLPKHGLEYRVLSNAWLSHPAIAQFTRELFRQVSGLAMACVEDVFDYKEEEVVRIILDHDVDEAKKLVKRNETNYRTLLRGVGNWTPRCVDKGITMMQGSVTDFVNPLEIEENWRFKEAWVGNSGLPNTRWGDFGNR